MNWDDYFFGIMRAVAAKSKDRSVKIGAVISGPDHEVLSVGYNGFPRGVDDDVEWRHERPAKYLWTEHAERNAIYNAARSGVRLKGSTMHVPCPPCSRCARGIIQAGVARVVAEMSAADFLPARSAIAWREDIETALKMMREAGIEIVVVASQDWHVTTQRPPPHLHPWKKAVQEEFRVAVADMVSLWPQNIGLGMCDSCQRTNTSFVRFVSRGGHPWTLCEDRLACQDRAAGKKK